MLLNCFRIEIYLTMLTSKTNTLMLSEYQPCSSSYTHYILIECVFCILIPHTRTMNFSLKHAN